MEYLFIWLYVSMGIGFAQEFGSDGWKKVALLLIWPVFIGARLAVWCK